MGSPFAGKWSHSIYSIKYDVMNRYHKSLVGRDFKLRAQIGIFIVWTFLTPSEEKMWLSLAKVYQVA